MVPNFPSLPTPPNSPILNKNNKIKISEIVCKNRIFLNKLARTKSLKKRKTILRKATAEQLLAIAEICLNIVKSRFCLTTRQKTRLMPHVNFVRQLSRSRSERGARQVVQKGTGAAGLFAALLTPILIELARNTQYK